MSSDPGFSGIPGRPATPGTRFLEASESARPHYFAIQQNVTFINSALPRQQASAAAARLSRWSRSSAKRAFDLACVICTLPLSLPVFLFIGLAVRLTSRGPVLFRQTRAGRHGKTFTIYKFRTMPVHDPALDRPAVTTKGNQEFTPVGPFLRRFKLDELPQIFNVLRGEMSLVGPRPKMPQHQAVRLNCRPGFTGRATVVFAQEEVALSCIPMDDLDNYYHSVVLPMKYRLDSEYMGKATFFSDLKLILSSVLRNWSDDELIALLSSSALHAGWTHTIPAREEGYSAASVLATQKMFVTAQRQQD